MKAELKNYKKHIVSKDSTDDQVREDHKKNKKIKLKMIQELEIRKKALAEEVDKLKVKLMQEKEDIKNWNLIANEKVL